MHNFQWCLAAIEACGHFAMLLLSLMTATTGLAFAARWTTTAADLLGVGTRVVREGGEDGGVARMRVCREDGDGGGLEKRSRVEGGG
jgi:hypothetical protein